MKKILSLIIVMCLIISVMIASTVTVHALSGSCGANLTWTLSNGTLTISGTGEMEHYSYSTLPWKLNISEIKKVIINNGVTSIGTNAFYYCSNLENITIPDSVTSIDSSAFIGCSALNDITLPDNITYINFSAFENCGYYKNESNWENGVLYIGNYLIAAYDNLSGDYAVKEGTKLIASRAFDNCSLLTSIIIPDSVTDICYQAFLFCTGLKNVTLGNGVKNIYSEAFLRCENLEGVYIKDISTWCNIEFAGSNSNPLYYAKNLYVNNELATDLAIPKGVTNINDYAFIKCESLTSVTTPESVTRIGGQTFSNCINLKSVEVGKNLTNISSIAFENCTSLESVDVAESNTEYCSENGVVYNKAKTLIFYYPLGKKESEYIIPETVTRISDYVFEGRINLKSVIIHDNITNIGNWVFDGCTGLTSITIPKSVKYIGEYAFYKCTNLTKVYYTGTENEWNNISIYNRGNDCLTGAKIYYNCLGPRTETSFENGVYNVVPYNVPLKSTIIIAYYNDKALKHIEYAVYEGESHFDFSEYSISAYDGVKVFVWNGIETMESLCGAEIVE